MCSSHSGDLSAIVGHWPVDALIGSTPPVAAQTGLSGARVWRLATAAGPLCLRRWPHPSATHERLQWVHGLLHRASREGCDIVPVPLTTRKGETTICYAGHFWELAPWMPGAPASAHAQCRHDLQLTAAVEALARFHQAVETTDPLSSIGKARASSALRRRAEAIRQLNGDAIAQLTASIRSESWPAAAELARRIVSDAEVGRNMARAALDSWREKQLPLQPCLRDVHREHILFAGDRVTGLIDFGAMQVDSKAGDIARLLGSWAGDDPRTWQVGIQGYSSVAPLSEEERDAIAVFDTTATVLSAVNWVRWIFTEERHFAQANAVLDRMATLTQRLEKLVRDGPVTI